ncbi:MAG: stage III sporulation protein AF [Veillonellales bacterium]
MITAISAWLKNIILVVLFASFLELLLPNSSMQRFIRVIMGLFILLAILNPAIDMIQNKIQPSEVSAISTTSSNSSAANITNTLVEEREHITHQLYKKELAKQINAIVMAIDGVADANAAIRIEEQPGSKLSGAIQHITVYVQPGVVGGEKKVAKVIIGDPATNSAEELSPQVKQKIQQTIAELYQLPKDKIDVQLLY